MAVNRVPVLKRCRALGLEPMVLGYDNVRSLSIKCEYILEKGLLGGMYWEYSGDNDNADLARTVYETIMKTSK